MVIDAASPRILVVRALQLGDMLCAVPALRALRNWQPDAHITLCGLPWAGEFVNGFQHLVDDFLLFPGYPGLPEQPFCSQRWSQWQQSLVNRFDLVLQLHGSGPFINDFVRTLDARVTAGFHPADQPELALDVSVTWPEHGHEIERLKAIVLALGAPDCGNQLELPLEPGEQIAADRLLLARGVGGSDRYVCLHAGGRSLTRRWPVARFAEVAQRLIARGQIVVLTGTGDEVDLARQLIQAVPVGCVDLVGQTDFGQLIAVVDRAEMLLSNDTGVSHIAAARRTPSVVIGLGSELTRWLPMNRRLHRYVAIDVPCRPCFAPTCPIGFPCADGVTVEMVLEAIQQNSEGRECSLDSSNARTISQFDDSATALR